MGIDWVGKRCGGFVGFAISQDHGASFTTQLQNIDENYYTSSPSTPGAGSGIVTAIKDPVLGNDANIRPMDSTVSVSPGDVVTVSMHNDVNIEAFTSTSGGFSTGPTSGFTLITTSAPAEYPATTPADGGLIHSTTQLLHGAVIPGTYSFASSVGPTLGAVSTQPLPIVFTPLDTATYPVINTFAPISIFEAPALSLSLNPINITYGTALATTQLSGTATVEGVGRQVSGTFTFFASEVGTVLNAGNGQSADVTFTPTDITTYAATQGTVTVNVSQATPTVNWNAPAPIAFLTPLSAAQLNATASVPGTFAYAPAAGTLLAAGSKTLSVKFTPASSNYSTVITTVPLTVLGPGVSVIGSQLYIVGGANSNDHVTVNATGGSNTGSTGVQVQTQLDGMNANSKYTQVFTNINVFLGNGNENVQFSDKLTIGATIVAGTGNDNITLANGDDNVTVVRARGRGNVNVQVGDGNNVVTLQNTTGNGQAKAGHGANTIVGADGNIGVQIGDGSNNRVMLGNGNDNVQIGDGSNQVVTLGNGNDNVQIGNGSNQLVTLGNGNNSVHIGNGNSNDITVGNGTNDIHLGDGNLELITVGTGNDNVEIGDGSNNTVLVALPMNPKTKVKFGKGSNNVVKTA